MEHIAAFVPRVALCVYEYIQKKLATPNMSGSKQQGEKAKVLSVVVVRSKSLLRLLSVYCGGL